MVTHSLSLSPSFLSLRLPLHKANVLFYRFYDSRSSLRHLLRTSKELNVCFSSSSSLATPSSSLARYLATDRILFSSISFFKFLLGSLLMSSNLLSLPLLFLNPLSFTLLFISCYISYLFVLAVLSSFCRTPQLLTQTCRRRFISRFFLPFPRRETVPPLTQRSLFSFSFLSLLRPFVAFVAISSPSLGIASP